MGVGILPSSLETRGIALPLTTPFFAFARLRATSMGLSLSLPSFEKQGHCYLIPLTEVGSILPLSVFDRALLEDLAGFGDPDPETVQEIIVNVELTGLRGARSMRQRRAEQAGEETDPITGTEPTSLKALLEELRALADDLRRWLIHEPVDAAELAQRTSLALRNTVKLAEPLLEKCLKEGAGDAHSDLIYLVDGWPRIITRWKNAQKGEFYQQREALTGFFLYIPLVPADLAGADRPFWEELATVQMRWLRRSPLLEDLDSDTKSLLSRNMRPLG
ncbi:hypothetical protein [Aestuariispira insulae]|uniref:Uncharacterized protein n=1 Tax=Aestuariispira insulae TaxID=1461337 RepID=A0A3D9HPS6_9PROT|nr:hypothetical protein [Aestuariispira insulae]RED51472.1 hypothetical protein DFP90_103274 [Aestuariispira insulae]